jgi:hypothetical protein
MRHAPRSPRQDAYAARGTPATAPRQDASASSPRVPRASHLQAARALDDQNETYAVSYFKNNPDAVLDTRPPEEKLETLESRLTDFDVEATEKLTILIHQKSLNYIIYGEDSPEATRSHLSLGAFYNDNHRPKSALRHLQRVVELREENGLEHPEEIRLAIELADAHLAMRNENRIEAHKQVGLASEALRNFMEEPINDPALRYHRDPAKGDSSRAAQNTQRPTNST